MCIFNECFAVLHVFDITGVVINAMQHTTVIVNCELHYNDENSTDD